MSWVAVSVKIPSNPMKINHSSRKGALRVQATRLIQMSNKKTTKPSKMKKIKMRKKKTKKRRRSKRKMKMGRVMKMMPVKNRTRLPMPIHLARLPSKAKGLAARRRGALRLVLGGMGAQVLQVVRDFLNSSNLCHERAQIQEGA